MLSWVWQSRWREKIAPSARRRGSRSPPAAKARRPACSSELHRNLNSPTTCKSSPRSCYSCYTSPSLSEKCWERSSSAPSNCFAGAVVVRKNRERKSSSLSNRRTCPNAAAQNSRASELCLRLLVRLAGGLIRRRVAVQSPQERPQPNRRGPSVLRAQVFQPALVIFPAFRPFD